MLWRFFMKKLFLSTAVFAFLVLGYWGCSRDNSGTPSNPSSTAPTPTPTPSSGPQTIMVSTGTNSSSASGYSYFVGGVTNNSDGSLSLSAHVGDTIILPSSTGFHPLYFDPGSTTCIASGTSNSPVTYIFPATGTYYFHCGNHGRTCSPLGACGYTTCTAMAGRITVN